MRRAPSLPGSVSAAADASGEELVAGDTGAETLAANAVDERRYVPRLGRPEDVALEQRLAVPAGKVRRDRRAEAGAGHGWKRRHIASSRSWSLSRSSARSRERPAVSS
jgi:hypothetical protein